MPRLTRSQVIQRLRDHAAEHGFVSQITLHDHDRILRRSIPLHFVGLDAARHAAQVPGPPYAKGGAKRGPKAGTKMRGRRRIKWTRQSVLETLRRLHHSGRSTRLDDLIQSGLAVLVESATIHVGGLKKARALAGIPQPVRRTGRTKLDWWTKAEIITAIRSRLKRNLSLATTQVPQTLYRAARHRFGSWPKALDALGIDPREARATNRKYTKDEIVRRLRQAARKGSDLRAVSLRGIVDHKAIHREFGTLANAIHAAGLDPHLMRRKHGLQKWDRDRVIAMLRERAARGEHSLGSNQYNLVLAYFGSTEAARAAAGVPSPQDLRREAKRRAALGITDRRGMRRRLPRRTAVK